MSRYHSNSNAPENAGSARRDDLARHDRQSPGSERGSAYSPYAPPARDDSDSADDPHLALTTQTLNADGTPKRPMNAFMIFARKRRPQISAANQMMRTGDISKILSKEWNTMDMSDKKFYLDQAKKLKDTFNSKWPDYVYRRRPNNTRKKRKSDGGQNSPSDPSPTGDLDDAAYDETSPIDTDDLLLAAADFPDSRSHTGSITSTYEGHSSSFSPHASSPYNYPSAEYSSGQYGQSSSRPTHLSPTDPVPSPGSLPPFKLTAVAESSHAPSSFHTHSQTSGHSQQSSSSYYSPQNTYSAQSSWDPNRASLRTDQGRSSLPSLPAIDTSISRYRTNTAPSLPLSRTDMYSPQTAHRPYSSSSTASSSPGTSNYSNSNFPILTSAFTPAESPTQRHANAAPGTSSAHMNSTQDYFQSSSPQYLHRAPTSTGRHSMYDSGGYTAAPTSNPYTSSSQWNSSMQAQNVRPSGSQQRFTAPIPPLSSFPLHPSTSTSSEEGSPASSVTSSGQQNPSHMAYWDRTKFEGR